MTKLPELPWLRTPADQLTARLAHGQVPQALLIHGPAGVGRRHLALWFAARLLDSEWTPAVDIDPDTLPGVPHADFFGVGLEDDKKAIGVNQLRELIAFMGLTSYRGGRKVAMIFPAEAMNHAAANSLLKTLEEPPGSASILLVSGTPSRLPATILSRCERIRLAPPPFADGLKWLALAHPDAAARGQALAFASGAPLAARALLSDNFGKLAADLSADIGQLVRRESPPTTIARRWARLDAALCIRWLYWQVAALMQSTLSGAAVGDSTGDGRFSKPPLKIPEDRLNMAACCEYLDRLNQAHRLQDRSLNSEVQFAELLMWWYGAVGPAR